MTDNATPSTPNPSGCPVDDVFNLLGRAHMLDLLHAFHTAEGEPKRFNELEDTLNISPNTLSARLKELTNAGLLDRRSFNEIPPRVEYHATQKTHDLCSVFDEIEAWATRHNLETAPTP